MSRSYKKNAVYYLTKCYHESVKRFKRFSHKKFRILEKAGFYNLDFPLKMYESLDKNFNSRLNNKFFVNDYNLSFTEEDKQLLRKYKNK